MADDGSIRATLVRSLAGKAKKAGRSHRLAALFSIVGVPIGFGKYLVV